MTCRAVPSGRLRAHRRRAGASAPAVLLDTGLAPLPTTRRQRYHWPPVAPPDLPVPAAGTALSFGPHAAREDGRSARPHAGCDTGAHSGHRARAPRGDRPAPHIQVPAASPSATAPARGSGGRTAPCGRMAAVRPAGLCGSPTGAPAEAGIERRPARDHTSSVRPPPPPPAGQAPRHVSAKGSTPAAGAAGVPELEPLKAPIRRRTGVLGPCPAAFLSAPLTDTDSASLRSGARRGLRSPVACPGGPSLPCGLGRAAPLLPVLTVWPACGLTGCTSGFDGGRFGRDMAPARAGRRAGLAPPAAGDRTPAGRQAGRRHAAEGPRAIAPRRAALRTACTAAARRPVSPARSLRPVAAPPERADAGRMPGREEALVAAALSARGQEAAAGGPRRTSLSAPGTARAPAAGPWAAAGRASIPAVRGGDAPAGHLSPAGRAGAVRGRGREEGSRPAGQAVALGSRCHQEAPPAPRRRPSTLLSRQPGLAAMRRPGPPPPLKAHAVPEAPPPARRRSAGRSRRPRRPLRAGGRARSAGTAPLRPGRPRRAVPPRKVYPAGARGRQAAMKRRRAAAGGIPR